MATRVRSASFCRPTRNGRLLALEPVEAADVGDGELGRLRGAVVLGEARAPAGGQLGPARRALRGDELLAQLVLPRAGERDELALELRERDVGHALRAVHGDVDADLLGLAEHRVRLHRARAEAPAQQRLELADELGVVAVGRERGDQRDRAAVRAAAAEQPDAVALQREQRDDGAAQVVRAGREELVLRERVEQRDRGLVVVRALDQVLVAEDLAQLAVEQRRLGGGLGVGLAREQAEHARLAGDAPVRPDLADADVVHPRAAVHGGEPVGLGDDQQVALERALAHLVREVGERPRAGVGGGRLVGEDPEAGAGHDAERVVLDPVLPVAEEDEVVLEQPLQEGDGLVDLVVGVARGAGARELHHAAAAVGHRREVEHRAADVAQHGADGAGELLELRLVEPPVELEVHDRLARRRLARVQHAGDPPVRRRAPARGSGAARAGSSGRRRAARP